MSTFHRRSGMYDKSIFSPPNPKAKRGRAFIVRPSYAKEVLEKAEHLYHKGARPEEVLKKLHINSSTLDIYARSICRRLPWA